MKKHIVIFSVLFLFFLYIKVDITFAGCTFSRECSTQCCKDGSCVDKAECSSSPTNTPAPKATEKPAEPTSPPANTPAPESCSADCSGWEDKDGCKSERTCWGPCNSGCCSRTETKMCNDDDGNGGGGGGNNTPGVTNTPASNAATPTPVPPTPTPTRAPLPPTNGTHICSDYGWKATLNWTKSTDTAVTDYIFRANYKDPFPPEKSWFLNDGTDIVGAAGNVSTKTIDVLPNRQYIDWSITSWISATNKGDMSSRFSKFFTDGEYFCKQILPPGRTACVPGPTGACTVDVWAESFKVQNGYPIVQPASTLHADVGINGAGNEIIDLMDFEKIRQDTVDNAPSPTPTP